MAADGGLKLLARERGPLFGRVAFLGTEKSQRFRLPQFREFAQSGLPLVRFGRFQLLLQLGNPSGQHRGLRPGTRRLLQDS